MTFESLNMSYCLKCHVIVLLPAMPITVNSDAHTAAKMVAGLE